MRARGKYFVSYIVTIDFDTKINGDLIYNTEYSFNEKTIEDIRNYIKDEFTKSFPNIKAEQVAILNILNMNGL